MTQCEIILLGCGGSGGVPLVTGYWGNCNPNNPKNRRTRASIAIRTTTTCIVIDTGPDFHQQTLTHGLSHIDAVIYTHDHADHVGGVDELRYLAILRRKSEDENSDYKIPIYADSFTLDSLKTRYQYMFKTSDDGLYVPLIDPHLITDDLIPITIGDITLQPFYQTHGAGKSLGFRIGDFAYSTDVSDLGPESLQVLKGIKTWVVDCGQFGSEFTTVHPNEVQVGKWNDVVQARHMIYTHLTPRVDYDELNNATPDNIEPAYDGMVLTANL